MRATVLNDPALAKQAGRFAWLSINSEDARNADVAARLAIDAFPTFFVVDSATGAIALRWSGSLTVRELERLLDDGERAVAAKRAPPAAAAGRRAASGAPAATAPSDPTSQADAALARADRLGADDKPAEAARAYADALGLAPPGWPGRGRAVESLLMAQQ